MKRFGNVIGTIIGVIIVIAVVLNTWYHVSDNPESSYGIVEDFLFGKPISQVLGPAWSKNYRNWETAADASSKVATLIIDHSVEELIINKNLTEERKEAIRLSQLAFDKGSSVSKDYLKKSNVELPEVYYKYFIPAMDAWRKGFLNKDLNLVNKGVTDYNGFISWMKIQNPNDFNKIR